MLKWYKNLYVGNTAKKKEKAIRRKINCGLGTFDIYVVTVAAGQGNNLDIFSAGQLLKAQVRKRCPMIVGIAVGYEEALEIVEQIVKDVWERTGTVEVRSWLLSDQEG